MKTKQQVSIRWFFARTCKVLMVTWLTIIMVAFNSTTLYAQTEFLAENQKQQVYYDSLLTLLGADSMQGTGYKQYQRWYRYWAPKLSVNYDFDDYQNDLLNYSSSYVAPQGNGSGPDWKLIGPNDVPFSGFSARGTGQIHYIYKDPINENTFYACSPVGGLFKSTDNGDSWFNLGTDKGLPRSGVSSVVVDSRTSSTLYVTTGNGEGFAGERIWQTSIGVWRTDNDGTTWENIGLGADTNGDYVYHMRKVIEIKNNTDSTHLIASTTEGLYGSRNANKLELDWEELIDGEFYDVVQDPVNNNFVYASGSSSTGIFKYNLNNNTATKIFDIDTISFPYDTIERPELRRISIKIAEAIQDTTYMFALVSMRDYDFTTIYRYNLANGVWHRFYGDNFPNGYARKLGWAIRPGLNDSSQLQILGRNVNPLKLFYNGLSNNDSSKVNKVHYDNSSNAHDDFHYLYFEDSTTLWAGTDGGVYKGEFINDTLIEWTSKNKGLGVATIEFIDAKYGYVTSGQFDCASNIYRTDDEINWEVINKHSGDGFQNIIDTGGWYYLSAQDGAINTYFEDENPTYSLYMPWDDEVNPDCTLTGDSIHTSIFSTYYIKLEDKFYAAGQKEVMIFNYANNNKWLEWSNLNSLIGCAISGTWRVAAKDNNGTHQIYASAYDEPGPFQHLYKSIGGGGPNYWVKINSTPDTGWINAIEITGNTDSVLVSVGSKFYSVNTTTPASPNWHDLTFNLDAGTINSIYRNSSKTWLATERGVYYLEDETNSWVDYSSDLPNCEVKDIKVIDKRVYVGTYGRGVWFAGAPDCGNIDDDYVLETDETVPVNLTNKYYRNIVVPNGITYTIYGTVKMATDCKIVVERGGKLIVDGGTITNACPDFWQGVEVRGSSNALQDTIHQGWVILKNGATIEYAKQGIATIKVENYAIYLAYAGGVIEADSSYFKNNLEDVVFFPYPEAYPTFPIMNNKSYFKNTAFVTDSNYYYFSDEPVNHIHLEDVLGVLFENNVFANTADVDLVDDSDRGIGIISWDAGFIANNGDGNPYGNVFENLYYGIKAYAFSNPNRLIDIDGNTFNHNRTGCYLSAKTYANVNRNTFNAEPESSISSLYSHPGYTFYTGLYLDNCTGYQVEDNEFESEYDPNYGQDLSYTSIGLVVNNSGPDPNMIYDNYFHSLNYATLAQNKNRDKSEEAPGLQYKCNVFEDNFFDISVEYQGDPHTMNGIALHQGSADTSLLAPAGNLFTEYDDVEMNYFNICNHFYYHLPHEVVGISLQRIIPRKRSDNTKITLSPNNANEMRFWTRNDGCPSNLNTRTEGELKTMITDNEENRKIYSDSLDSMVDDGNTPALNLDVSTSIPPETMELRDELLDASPYLSDTVMANAAEKEDVLPNSIITEVLTANPQSARADNVLNALDERDNPPSESQMASIHANDTVIGAKELLESKKVFYASQKQQSVNRLIRLYITDTLVAKNDSIEAALSNISILTSYYNQAFCRFNDGDSLEVLNKLADINSSFDLNDYEADMHDAYKNYFELLLELQATGKQITEVDSTQKNTLFTIMQNSNEILQAYCRNMLIRTDGLIYYEPYLLPDTNSNKSVKLETPFTDFDLEQTNYFKLYPNPAYDYITLEYNLPYGSDNVIMEMLNMKGLQLEVARLKYIYGQKVIDLRDYTGGIYVIRLWADGKVLQSTKFTKF